MAVINQNDNILKRILWKTGKSVRAAKEQLKASYGFEGALKKGNVDLKDEDTLQLGSTYQLVRRNTSGSEFVKHARYVQSCPGLLAATFDVGI